MIAAVLDHLWQSTLFAAGAAMLTLMARNNGAAVRYWLWFAASAKFLIPFAALTMLGTLLRPLADAGSLPVLHVIAPAVRRFSLAPSAMLPAVAAGWTWEPLLLAAWGIGFASVLGIWLSRWLRLRLILRTASDLPFAAPVPVRASASFLEPGLVGIRRPLILLPNGIAERLAGAEITALLAHELSHLRRRDNLTALIHMAVEALFWFYPPVWWIGARLIEERERACDEAVLASGHDPRVYAEAILQVCKFYLHSPLASAPGASGGSLTRRLEAIMANPGISRLGGARKLALGAAAAAAIAAPLVAGILSPPVLSRTSAAMIAWHPAAALNSARAGSGRDESVAEPVGMHIPIRVAQHRATHTRVAKAAEASRRDGGSQPEPFLAANAGPAREQAPLTIMAASATGATPIAVQGNIDGNVVSDSGSRIVCLPPEHIPGSRLSRLEVCQTLREWMAMAAKGLRLAPDGMIVAASDDYYPRRKACPSVFVAMPIETVCF